MQEHERPKADTSGDDDDDDNAVDGAGDAGVPSPRLSCEATRSKSEQDLGRVHSLELLTVMYGIIH